MALGTRPSAVRRSRNAEIAPKSDTNGLTAKWNRNVCYAQDPIPYRVGIVPGRMDPEPFEILQFNTQKRMGAMHSIMNDESLKYFGVLLILEPHVWKNSEGKAIFTPMAHSNWTKTEPTVCNDEGRLVYRSMIWTQVNLETEQVPVELSDIIAVIVWLPLCTILIFSVYV